MIKKTTKQCKTTDRTPTPSVELDSLQTACCRHTAARDCQQANQGHTAARDCQQANQGQTAARDCQQASQGQTAARNCQQASQGQIAVRDCQQASQGQIAARDCQQANQVHITASHAVDCHTRWFPGGQPLCHATPTAHTQTHGLCHYSQNWVCWRGRWVPHQYPPVHDGHHCQSQN